jgi:hypothetical protein
MSWDNPIDKIILGKDILMEMEMIVHKKKKKT